MTGFESRLERLEVKYLIGERTAERIVRQLELYCHPDVHGEANRKDGAHPSYAVQSLYLDSPGLAFHQAKERGDPERMKLRLRTYADPGWVVLERKRRVADVIDKTRATVGLDEYRDICLGRAVPAGADSSTRRFLDEFAGSVARSGAGPTLHVRYQREAYSSVVDQYARLTLDRNIEAQRTSDWSLDADPDHWSSFDDWWGPEYFEPPAILELKCHLKIPGWMTELVKVNGLRRESFSKYSVGIYATGRSMGFDLAPRRSARKMR